MSEFGYEIEYIPGRVNRVPDAMSRLLIPGEDKTPLDTDVPVFDLDEPWTSSFTHARILVTTRARAQAGKQDTAPSSSPQKRVAAHTEGNEGNTSSERRLPSFEHKADQLPSSGEAHANDGKDAMVGPSVAHAGCGVGRLRSGFYSLQSGASIEGYRTRL